LKAEKEKFMELNTTLFRKEPRFDTHEVHDGGSYDAYHVTDGQRRNWKVVSDASIHPAMRDERAEGTIEFRLFNGMMHAGKVKTYIQLSLAISHQTLVQKGASHSRTKSTNEKYTLSSKKRAGERPVTLRRMTCAQRFCRKRARQAARHPGASGKEASFSRQGDTRSLP